MTPRDAGSPDVKRGQIRLSYYLAALCLIAVTAISLRVADITADLPAYFAGGSQDFTTDAAYLTMYAKSAVQFGAWNLFGFEPWTTFMVSIISGLSYIMFLLFGVSRATAALTGTILQLAGLSFFVAGCAQWLRRQTVLLIASLLAVNYLLVLYGRVPFSENGLLFFAGAAFWVYSRWFDRDWGKVLVGVLIALAALLGKSFGFLLVGGPLLYVLVRREKVFRSIFLLVAPIVLVTLVYIWFFSGQGGLISFLYEHGVGEHGTPHGIGSVAGFFESLISVSRTGLHTYTPALSCLTYVVALTALVGTVRFENTARPLYFMIGWAVTWLILLSPFNYQPVRYLYVLTVPMAALLGIVVQQITEQGLAFRRRLSLWRMGAMFFLNWYATFAAIVGIAVDTLGLKYSSGIVWISLPIALTLTTVIVLSLRFIRVDRMVLVRSGILLPAALTLILVTDSWNFFGWFSTRTHMIQEASSDIAAMLNSGAVLGGQCGPAIAANAPFASVRLFLRQDLQAFERQISEFPVTHVALEATSYQSQGKRSKILQQSPVLTTFWLRDSYIVLLRISTATLNATANRYIPTEYERAIDLMYQGNFAGAEDQLRRFLAKHPHNKAALIEQYYLTLLVKHPAEAEPIVDTMTTYYPTDYSVSLLAAIYYKYYAKATGDQAARAKSESLYQNALTYSGVNRPTTIKMYENYSPKDRIIR